MAANMKGQVADYGSSNIHIQAKGENGNRKYGYAATFPVDEATANLVKAAAATLPSLAGTERKYAPVKLVVRPDGKVRVRFEFEVEDADLGVFIAQNS